MSRFRFWTLACDLLLLILVVLLVFFWRPVVSLFGECALYSTTGLWCPGCGTTRMFLALRNFDFWRAFCMNPLVFLLLCYLLLALLLCNLNVLFGWRAYRWLLNERALWIIAACCVCFALVRNLPFPPFCYLIAE